MGPAAHTAHHDSVFVLRVRTDSLQHLRISLHFLVSRARSSAASSIQLLQYGIVFLLFPSFIHRYLYEFLYGWLISAYNRAECFLNEHHTAMELLKSKNKGTGAGKKGGQSGNGKSKRKKEKSNPRPYAKEIANCQAMQSMCGGYYKVT